MDKGSLFSFIGLITSSAGIVTTATLLKESDDQSDLITLVNDYPVLDSYENTFFESLENLPKIDLYENKDMSEYYSQIPCAKYIFGFPKWKKQAEDANIGNHLDLSKGKGTYAPLKIKRWNVEGCLTVWWEKETFEDQKWKGKWNLVWAFSGGGHGVLLSSIAKTENGELKVYGKGYTLKKKKDGWETIARHSTNGQKVTTENREQFVIKSGASVEGNKGRLWGFGFDIENICSNASECTGDGKKSSSKKSWSFVAEGGEEEGAENKPLKAWSDNFGTWSSKEENSVLFPSHHANIYSEIRGHFHLVSSSLSK